MNALNTSMSPPESSPVKGVVYMVLSGLCFISLTAGVKYLGPGIPAPQSAFLRYALGLVFLIPMLGVLRRAVIDAALWRAFIGRGAAHTFAVMLWFYAMTQIPIAEVSAMGYLSPIFTSIGAAFFLGERLRLRRIAAIAAAVVGALVILRPGMRELNAGHLAMLGTSLFFSISYLMAKSLSGKASPMVVVSMLSVVVTIGLIPFAAAVWQPVSLFEVAVFFAIAAAATLGHYLMTMAFACAPITVTQPVTALGLVWSVVLGATLFDEPVDAFVVLGGLLIVGAVIFIALREHQLRRRGA
ncbi:MAG: DMT family transporter [Paracoccaceae bacterium]